MLKFLPILVLALVAAKAYDFKDFDFNHLIMDEFNVDDIGLATKRRAGKQDFLCCIGDKFDPEHFRMIMETKKECAMKLRANNSDVENFDVFDCAKMDRIKQLLICEGECFSKTKNIFNESGKMNRDEIIKQLGEHLVNGSEWKTAVYEGYVDKCLAKVEASERRDNQKCSGAPLEFHHCMWVEFMNGCPADLRVDTPKCNKMRERHILGTGSFLIKNSLNEF